MENQLNLLDPSLDKQLKGHRGIITSLFYNPNELQIASGSLDNSVLLWDLSGTMRSYRFRGHEEAVMDVSFSPSGKYMASASRDKSVRLWVPTVTGSTGMFKAHSQTVRSVQFSPDGSKIVTASDDKIVKLWSSEKYKFIASFVGHTNWVRCARMSSDGSIIASCSDDKSTRLWNPDSGELIHTYKDQKGHPMYVAWHPSGCYVAVATSQGNIKLFDIRTHNLVQYYSIHTDAVTQITFHPSGSYVLTASKDGKMKILDLLEGHPIFTLSGHTGPVNTVCFSPSGETFASAGEDKLVNLWKTNFTELANETKENIVQNPTVQKTTSQISKLTSTTKGKNQGPRTWYLCYHTVKYPATAFVHIDEQDPDTELYNSHEPAIFPSIQEHSDTYSTLTYLNMRENVFPNRTIVQARHDSTFSDGLFGRNSKSSTPKHSSAKSCNCPTDLRSCDCLSNSVGHMSHIPRTPPSPATYTIPSFMPTNNRSIGTATCFQFEEDLFGMIKLKENDVCYTSGTIEWVGRKRSYPINSGFKILNDTNGNEPFRKMKKFEKSCEHDKTGDCDCPDVLPTVNAIVDHLNALHEAVDLVDLRLNTLEGTHKKSH